MIGCFGIGLFRTIVQMRLHPKMKFIKKKNVINQKKQKKKWRMKINW